MKQVTIQRDAVFVRGDLTRKEVAALRQELLSALTVDTAPKVLRLAEVTSIDSAGIQVLCALVKGFPGVRITDVPASVFAVCDKIGAGVLLGGA